MRNKKSVLFRYTDKLSIRIALSALSFQTDTLSFPFLLFTLFERKTGTTNRHSLRPYPFSSLLFSSLFPSMIVESSAGSADFAGKLEWWRVWRASKREKIGARICLRDLSKRLARKFCSISSVHETGGPLTHRREGRDQNFENKPKGSVVLSPLQRNLMDIGTKNRVEIVLEISGRGIARRDKALCDT